MDTFPAPGVVTGIPELPGLMMIMNILLKPEYKPKKIICKKHRKKE